MKPRMKTSKKWTQFPKDYTEQIIEVFSEAFAAQLVDAKLVIEGRIYPEEILLRVGYLENGRIRQDNFEISANYSQKNQDAQDKINYCIDAAASMMSDYFENPEESTLPREWKEFEFEGQPLWLQYSTTNSELEAEADRLLGATDPHLVEELEASEDAMDFSDEKIEAKDLDNDDDVDGDFESPREYDAENVDYSEDEEIEDNLSTAKPSIFTKKGKLVTSTDTSKTNSKKKKEDLH